MRERRPGATINKTGNDNDVAMRKGEYSVLFAITRVRKAASIEGFVR